MEYIEDGCGRVLGREFLEAIKNAGVNPSNVYKGRDIEEILGLEKTDSMILGGQGSFFLSEDVLAYLFSSGDEINYVKINKNNEPLFENLRNYLETSYKHYITYLDRTQSERESSLLLKGLRAQSHTPKPKKLFGGKK